MIDLTKAGAAAHPSPEERLAAATANVLAWRRKVVESKGIIDAAKAEAATLDTPPPIERLRELQAALVVMPEIAVEAGQHLADAIEHLATTFRNVEHQLGHAGATPILAAAWRAFAAAFPETPETTNPT
jgi:hypothetical protein